MGCYIEHVDIDIAHCCPAIGFNECTDPIEQLGDGEVIDVDALDSGDIHR